MNTINSGVSSTLLAQQSASAKPVKPEKTASEAADAPRESNSKPQAKGVIRLLESGHFEGKGVADVRLRINFYEQLEALDSAKVQEATQNALSELDQFIGDTLEEYSETPKNISAGVKEFQNIMRALDSGESGATSVAEGIRVAFDELMKGLTPPSTPEGESTASQTKTTESTGSLGETNLETPSTGTAQTGNASVFDIDALIGALNEGMNNFEASLASATEAQQFVRPEGNGKAFDKFVAMYESMSNTGLTQEDSQPSTLVDQTV